MFVKFSPRYRSFEMTCIFIFPGSQTMSFEMTRKNIPTFSPLVPIAIGMSSNGSRELQDDISVKNILTISPFEGESGVESQESRMPIAV